MQITIHDEATRRVVFQMLWNHAHDQANGETFSDRLYEHSWTRIDPRLGVPPRDCDPSEHLSELMDLLAATRAASGQLEAIELGATIDVPFDRAAVVSLAASCQQNIEEDEEFWRAPKEDQSLIIVCRNAAVQLMEEYSDRAEAVA
jgi:hypothetical protein